MIGRAFALVSLRLSETGGIARKAHAMETKASFATQFLTVWRDPEYVRRWDFSSRG
jgi:hypothetical protein